MVLLCGCVGVLHAKYSNEAIICYLRLGMYNNTYVHTLTHIVVYQSSIIMDDPIVSTAKAVLYHLSELFKAYPVENQWTKECKLLTEVRTSF